MQVHPARIRPLGFNPPKSGPVVLWMGRDQRADDNWALLHAAALAKAAGAPLLALFALPPDVPPGTARHADFLLRGLGTVEAALRDHGIPLVLLPGDPAVAVPAFLRRVRAGVCVTDFDPLRPGRAAREAVAATPAWDGAFFEVDAHNVVPAFAASPKREYAAATFRPKILKLLPEFLEPFPDLPAFPAGNLAGFAPVDWEAARAGLVLDPAVAPVAGITPGPEAAREALADFLADRLPVYADRRNDPNAGATSTLSPWLHFGHLAPQRAALDALAAKKRAPAGAEAFLEELVVRRELADNYCLHEPAYDTFAVLPAWARKTLLAHAADPRPYVYSAREFEAAATHSALWNAAQRALVGGGRLHGYLRMYWAKKILEWSATPEEALATALSLNDRYALDGSDPSGVAGVLWSVGGLHDRPWANRPVFGQIRYMNERGCRRKFDVDAYIARHGGGGADQNGEAA
uniref:Deoxyribodipyrimidine photo-lyase n=1 Tax=Desulfovibrio sp. U5L TaxID=596152 RepID=I2PZ64_9BACT